MFSQYAHSTWALTTGLFYGIRRSFTTVGGMRSYGVHSVLWSWIYFLPTFFLLFYFCFFLLHVSNFTS